MKKLYTLLSIFVLLLTVTMFTCNASKIGVQTYINNKKYWFMVDVDDNIAPDAAADSIEKQLLNNLQNIGVSLPQGKTGFRIILGGKSLSKIEVPTVKELELSKQTVIQATPI